MDRSGFRNSLCRTSVHPLTCSWAAESHCVAGQPSSGTGRSSAGRARSGGLPASPPPATTCSALTAGSPSWETSAAPPSRCLGAAARTLAGSADRNRGGVELFPDEIELSCASLLSTMRWHGVEGRPFLARPAIRDRRSEMGHRTLWRASTGLGQVVISFCEQGGILRDKDVSHRSKRS